MTEEEWVKHWQRVAGTVFSHDWGDNRALPGKDHLDALEAKLGLPLPLSFRAYIRVFGPGRLARRFVIFAPGYPHAPRVDFPDATGWQWLVEESDERKALIQDYVVFGDYLGHNGIFVWHRGELTDVENREYQIYFIPRPYPDAFIPMARSFSSLIEEDILESSFYPKYGVKLSDVELEWEDDDTGEMRNQRYFDPIGGAACPLSDDPRLN